MTLSLYCSGERSSARAPSPKRLVVTDLYSKCNAKSARTGLSSPESTDNMLTFFVFLTPAYISLHENAIAPDKFRRNGRSQGGTRGDRPNPGKNLAISDQNLAVFGKWKGATFHLNRDKYTCYGNWTCQKPFISFHALSPAGTPRAPEVPSSLEERSLLNARNRDGHQSSQAGNETGVPSAVQSAPNKSTGYKFHFLVNVSKCLTLSHSARILRARPLFSSRNEGLESRTTTRIRGCLIFEYFFQGGRRHTQGLTEQR